MTAQLFRLQGIVLALLGAATSMADAIEWPRISRPAVTVPGGVIEVGTREEGTLSLERDGQRTPLNATWSKGPGAILRGRVKAPDTIAPGIYALHLESSNGESIRNRAVHVLPEFPEEYTIAVVRGALPDPGAAQQSPLPPDLNTRLQEAQVHMVLMLGPLTRSGSAEEYQALEEQLAGIDLPLFLCPDSSDLRGNQFSTQFGPAIYGASFGRDAFLFLGAGLPAEDPRARESLGEAHALRRALRASRWSIGVAAKFGLDWDLRAQIALFVDDPLNALIAGMTAPGLGATVPWGKTAFVLPVEGPREPITLISISPTRIRPRSETEPQGAPAPPQEVAPAG